MRVATQSPPTFHGGWPVQPTLMKARFMLSCAVDNPSKPLYLKPSERHPDCKCAGESKAYLQYPNAGVSYVPIKPAGTVVSLDQSSPVRLAVWVLPRNNCGLLASLRGWLPARLTISQGGCCKFWVRLTPSYFSGDDPLKLFD